MTKFFMKWRIGQTRVPDAPQETVKLKLKMLEAIKAELSAGTFTEWGSFGNGIEGYAITEASEEDFYATLIRWMPVVAFEVFALLSVDQSMEATKKAAAAMQA